MVKTELNVCLFDDNVKFRQAIQVILSSASGINYTGSFPDCKNLLRDIDEASPDVVLMDIQMPGISGLDAVAMVKKNRPSCHVLMLTNFDEDESVFNAICNGASGYLLKNTSPRRLVEAIREVQEGGAPMTPGIARKMLQRFRFTQGLAPTTDEYHLSQRERDVLETLVKGYSLKMIADQLNISYETVRSHIKHIYQKLHVVSLTEAVAKALREKLI